MHRFADTDRTLFNVMITTTAGRHAAKNIGPVPWGEGCKLVQWGMLAVSRDLFPGTLDIEMEPATIPRPWSGETLSAYTREMMRDNAKGELLHAQLCQLIGTTGADAVRDGAL